MTAVQDPRRASPDLSLRFLISSNERARSAAAVNRGKVFDDTHLSLEHT